MTPLDPQQAVPATDSKIKLPSPPDEHPNQELVQQGLNVAEQERRDAVLDEQEATAMTAANPEARLDEIDRRTGGDSSQPAELGAMHEAPVPTPTEEDHRQG